MSRIFGQYVLTDMVVLWAFETCTCFVLLMTASGNVAFAPLPGHHHLIHLGATNSAVLSLALSFSCIAVGLYKPASILTVGMLLPLALIAGIGVVPVVWILVVAESVDLHRLGEHPAWVTELALSWVLLLAVTRLLYAAGVRRGLFVREVLILDSVAGAATTADAIAAMGSSLLRIWRPDQSVATLVQAPPLECEGALALGAPAVPRTDPSVFSRSARKPSRTSSRGPGPFRIVLATNPAVAPVVPPAWAGRWTRVSDAQTFWDRHLGRVDLDALSANAQGGSRTGTSQDAVTAPPDEPMAAIAIRRAWDVLLSLLLLALLAPVIAATALVIRLESAGPVVYRQNRVGLDGRIFTILKFRSMRTDAERDGVARFATIGDDRITAFGRLIRKVRIDELPQLVNILRGEMSIVGPRPERPDFVDAYRRSIPFYDRRHAVRPGLTGWAQVHCAYTATEAETRRKLSFDLYYVRNRSLLLDISIMVSTIRVILFQVGAR